MTRKFGFFTKGLSHTAVELIVASINFFLGILVTADSYRVGMGWASDGPQAGYIPFYIGILLSLSSGFIIIQTLLNRPVHPKLFIEPGRLKPVLSVLIPTIVYVIAIYFIGIYVASALFIAFFMRWQGGYGVFKILSVSLGVIFALFMLFEVWFLVPLPKGPLEEFLGF